MASGSSVMRGSATFIKEYYSEMLSRFTPLLATALLVVSCTSEPPTSATGTPTPTPAAVTGSLTPSPSPSATVAFSAPTPTASPTRQRLRDRAEASRKAKAVQKKAEEKKRKVQQASSTSAPDLLLWLPFDGNLNDRGPLSLKAQGSGIERCQAPDGSPGQAYEFFGEGSVSLPNVSNFNNLDEFTLSAWAAPIQRTDHSNIISKVTPGRDFNMQLNIEGQLMTHFENNGYEFATSQQSLPLNEWTFVAATFGNGEWKLYLNGELDSTHPVTKVPPWTGRSLTVGNLSPGSSEGFVGNLDDIRIYRRALTAQEIRSVMDGQP